MWKKSPSFKCLQPVIKWLLASLVSLCSVFSHAVFAGSCSGKFPNPIKDVCWMCMFPMKIGPIEIPIDGQIDNGDKSPPLLCVCPAPPPLFIRPGVGISFWEPARVAEVVRTPFCSPTLNGTVLAHANVPAGTHGKGDRDTESAFYQLHWFQYPLLSWIGMAFSSTACNTSETFDLAYMTELDPLWNDDTLSFILNPEAALFTSPVTQAACAGDSVKAAKDYFGHNSLFWCSGSQGSVYPLNGNHATHTGGIDSSLAVVHKHIFKMHRQFLALDTSTIGAMCAARPQPILRKTQYKQQMLHPVAQTKTAYGFGYPSTIWGSGKSFPYKGEDFSYLVWRKRTCCAY